MADITTPDKVNGNPHTAQEYNAFKAAINSKMDKSPAGIATEVGSSDYLVMVQGGIPKKLPSGLFSILFHGVAFAARKTICFRINDSDGNPPTTAPVAAGITVISIINAVTVNDLIARVPGQTRESCDVYRTQQWQAPYEYDSNTLLQGEDVFITFFDYQDMAALYDQVQQILAAQLAQ